MGRVAGALLFPFLFSAAHANASADVFREPPDQTVGVFLFWRPQVSEAESAGCFLAEPPTPTPSHREFRGAAGRNSAASLAIPRLRFLHPCRFQVAARRGTVVVVVVGGAGVRS
ncbi:hypothetical protein AAFF_G00230120 [Aldrovandia affinis]|uniref:Secreted protein n=1 Tax=Aldrovandia affinis TaxID=143900 RepID=A0AAD7SXF4_9TELE|nr:hypothetical protein AAFF_G00230120 [Aldrovandia affinis]